MAYERTLIAVRERSMLDLLDLALVVIRERPRTLGLTAMLGICPFLALNAYVLFPAMRAAGPDNEFLALLAIAFELPLATAPLTMVLGTLMFRDTPRPWPVIRGMLGALPRMILYQYIIRGICFFPILWPILPLRLTFLPEVILLERGKWTRVLKRVGALSSGRGGELFLFAIAQAIGLAAFALIFWAGTGQIFDLLFDLGGLSDGDGDGEDLFFDPRLQAGIWIGLAFLAVFRFLLYIDQRIRLEGWEVELRLRSVGSALEEDRRW